MTGRTIVCGDIHGNYRGLVQCMERSKFDEGKDTLVQLGDIADGWSEVYECIELLNNIPRIVRIRGNHDKWFEDYLETGIHSQDWLQGGEGTLKSYCRHAGKNMERKMSGFVTNLNPADIPNQHEWYFRNQVNYYRDENNNLFIHGGFNRHYLLKEHLNPHVFYWDRDLWYLAETLAAKKRKEFIIKEPVKEIFIGHTHVDTKDSVTPVNCFNIWNLDTGSGFSGVLTFMDVDTKEYWQSDMVQSLYPEEAGRN